MALAGLVTMKCGYMGGASGPPVVRHVDIPSLRLIISNNDIQRSEHTLKPNEVHEIPYLQDFQALDAALKELEQAKQRFEEAKVRFHASLGGEWANRLLNPDPELSIRDCLSAEEEELVRTELSKIGTLKNIDISKKGYSLICIKASYERENCPSVSTVESLNISGFRFGLYYGGATVSHGGYIEFSVVRGSTYPPQVEKDLHFLNKEKTSHISNELMERWMKEQQQQQHQ